MNVSTLSWWDGGGVLADLNGLKGYAGGNFYVPGMASQAWQAVREKPE